MGEQPGQNFRCGPALLYFGRHHVLPTVHLSHFQVVNANALSSGKAQGRFGRFALGIVGHFGRRTLDQLFPVLLFGSQTLNVDHQPPRGARHPYRAVLQSRFGQELWCLLSELLDGRGQISSG